MDYISKFINKIVSEGICPKSTNDIKETNTFKRISAETDKPHKKSISYWLRIERDFAYGYAKDFKTGIEVTFRSYDKDPSKSPADIARINAMRKMRTLEEDRKIAERHLKIAERAKTIWSQSRAGTAPYLVNKSIVGHSARVKDGNVIVPVYDHDKSGVPELVSWQVIKPNGEKRFPFGGKKQGCWHTIGQIDPNREIIICEGFATGDSISMNLKLGVIVAFDAGNMINVAKKLREIYKNTPILIATDNDKSGTGQKAAVNIQKNVPNSRWVMPPNEGDDFNDDKNSIKLLLQQVSAQPPKPHASDEAPKSPIVQTGMGDWMNNLILDKKGNLIGSSVQNAVLYVLYHEDFKGVFCFDEFRNQDVVMRCPPWKHEDKFIAATVTDIDITMLTATLERYGINLSFEKSAKVIETVANENRFHSARKYFNDLQWDGVCRLETMFFDHFGCTREDQEYLSFVARKWMTAAVKRIMVPGCKFDHVLVMESAKQGVSKSSALKTLVTFGDDETETYHTDAVSINELSNKDTVLKLQGNIIVELAELKGFNNQDDESIKNWITQQIDEVRLPFSRKVSKYKRQFLFAATTNKHDYLKDPTGNRRYWPITIEKLIDLDKLAEEREQLWAEAVYLYRSGLYIGPTPEENDLAEIERQKRFSFHPWTESVLKIVKSLNTAQFKTNDILDKMDLSLRDKTESASRKVADILQMNGYENKPYWNQATKKTERAWALAK